MALPSVDEAFGVAYVEALACGVPAIGSRGEGGPEEIASTGDGMLLVPPRDPAVLAEAIVELVSDQAELERVSAGARRTAAGHFSWEACGRATVAAYRDVMRPSDE
jgi:teichuronic acid biosynthesis glycosyltransferase TuaC